jgi:hypothetical protein
MHIAEIKQGNGDFMSPEEKSIGISKNMFIVGLLVAIVASTLISTIVVTQLGAIQGPKGDTGLQGEQGPQGNVGPAGPAGVFGSKASNLSISTTETMQFVDVDEMSVTLTLTETSHILIFFSCEAWPDYDETILIHALVGETVASPGQVYLVPIVWDYSETDVYSLWWGSYTYNFYQTPVDPGTYTIKIQWMISGGVGDMSFRTLTAMALPVAPS